MYNMNIEWCVLLWCINYVATLDENSCYSSTGKEGKCIAIHNCPYARYLLQKNEYPTTCGFEGNLPKVCCMEILEKSVARKPGDISAMKCKEYYPYKKYFLLVPGAQRSLAKEFPHMAIIGFGEEENIQWLCGGSLISRNFILTAAHCLQSRALGGAKWVRLGDLDLATDTDDAAPQQYAVKRSIPHPLYNTPPRYHDIGLIELEKNITLTEYVGIGCLDTERQHEEKQMMATGWGKTEFSGESSSFLLKSDLDVVSIDKCAPFYEKERNNLPNGILDDLQVCAGDDKKDTCQGDSGGPLQIINRNLSSSIIVYDIVGVTSFGKPCGLTKAPGIYTRVYNYISWIEDIVWPAS